MDFDNLKVGMVLHTTNHPHEMIFFIEKVMTEVVELRQHTYTTTEKGPVYKIDTKLIDKYDWRAANRVYHDTTIARSDELELFIQYVFSEKVEFIG
jgi:hypothetical protein